jgi:pilus assembly protein Flp/PilA
MQAKGKYVSRMYEALLRSFRRVSISETHPRVIVREVAGKDTRDTTSHYPGAKEVNPRMLSNLYLRLRELMVRKDDEEGQGMVEYALILVLIAVVVIVILTVVGHQVSNVFSNVSGGLGN